MTSMRTFVQMPDRPGRLLVITPDTRMRSRLRAILAGLGYGSAMLLFADRIASAQAQLASHPFAMAITDLDLPDGNGDCLIQTLRARDAALPILAISASSSGEQILRALRAGATGYLLKKRDDLEISLSIRSAMHGGTPIDPLAARHILEAVSSNALPPVVAARSHPRLSAREIEILSLLETGMANREIANALSLSTFTVESHVKKIYRKLNVHSRTEAVYQAHVHGLLG